ncbi:MAG: sensor histidine kinase [Nitrosopumilus sp.]
MEISKILAISIISISILYSTQFFLDESEFSYISGLSYVVIPGVLAVISAYVAVKEWKNNTRNKIAMVFFAIGAVCLFTAEEIWQIFEIVFEQDPFPSIADVFYIISYPFFIGFLILFVKPLKSHITKNIILFSIGISLVFLIPTLHVLFDYYHDEPSLDIAIGITYPILGSLLLFFTLIGMIFFIKTGRNYFWTLIFIGFLTEIIADTLFLFTIIDDSYHDGHISDLLFLISYLFFIAGIVLYLKTKNTESHNETSKITFEIISKFAIPLIIGTVFSVTSVSLVYSYFYGKMLSNESLLILLFIMLSVIIAIFSIIIFMINKNVNRFLYEKTRAIENQMKNLKTMLEEKDTALQESSEFSDIGENLSQIVHDLRNPLTIMKISLDMIERDAEKRDVTTRVESMKKAIQLMDEEISDILNYVKKPIVEKTETSILEILNSSIANMAIPKTISLHLPLKDEKIWCDSTRMVLVFMNLLTNAIDAMDKKGTIAINVTQNKNKIMIGFENSGPAIPSDVMEKMFEPLFTTKKKGTGLGLSTCQKIIRQHEGTINVQNNPTTFTIELPKIH